MNKLELITENLINTIDHLAKEAKEIYILTSFTMLSGVKRIQPVIKVALDQGADVKILTGDYLYITQPEALNFLVQELPNCETRLWQSGGKSFHPKAYLFRNKDNGHVIVGSSNMSASALTTGNEWNLYAHSSVDNEILNMAIEEYMQIFYHDFTIPINKETVKQYEENYRAYHKENSVLSHFTEAEEIEIMFSEPNDQSSPIFDPPGEYKVISQEDLKPRPAQKEALLALENTLEEEYDRALVVMATGLGKTYLAAFFAERFNRILFIAHQKELLEQAKKSFKHVLPKRTAGLLNAEFKETDKDMLFASVFTLGLNQNLNSFDKYEFDLIIIDEFHHAAANSYQKILDYFEPKFLLGITATPDRMDNKDVYSICGGNTAYRIHFIDAIQKQWLAPFIYYGVYDDTDYSALTWLGNRYDEEELLQVQLKDEMAANIENAWTTYRQTKTIGFCSSIKQSDFLSNYFNERGWRTISLHSKMNNTSRQHAIKDLEDGKIDIIFTVDLFNEGVDIPSVDTLLFVRPTQSLTVFTQQIGRGLRISEGKSHCVIIDLIGNYRNSDIKLQVFDPNPNPQQKRNSPIPTLPANCVMEFDVEAIDLLKEMNKKRIPRKDQLRFAYEDLKLELGRRPNYLEFHLKAKADSRTIKEYFGSFPSFLHHLDELSSEEEEIILQYNDWFMEVEDTAMSKSYKMVVLLYMLSKGLKHWLEPITPEETAPFFHQYLTSKEYRKRIDFSGKEAKQLLVYDEKKMASLVARMPMTKWTGSSKGMISFIDNIFQIHIPSPVQNDEILYEWTKQICEYRLHWHFERKSD